ncbi:hypothetical protein E2C01_006279 [Portunus trituberculatus]|uniref:Uncharacterized protein n=1 Tax=Portunus trituberculatus TaxID=210409 RepID=A0A5B7CXH1_PORTR|nr:hypothetical protein [Portunus trituberculatus]
MAWCSPHALTNRLRAAAGVLFLAAGLQESRTHALDSHGHSPTPAGKPRQQRPAQGPSQLHTKGVRDEGDGNGVSSRPRPPRHSPAAASLTQHAGEEAPPRDRCAVPRPSTCTTSGTEGHGVWRNREVWTRQLLSYQKNCPVTEGRHSGVWRSVSQPRRGAGPGGTRRSDTHLT